MSKYHQLTGLPPGHATTLCDQIKNFDLDLKLKALNIQSLTKNLASGPNFKFGSFLAVWHLDWTHNCWDISKNVRIFPNVWWSRNVTNKRLLYRLNLFIWMSLIMSIWTACKQYNCTFIGRQEKGLKTINLILRMLCYCYGELTQNEWVMPKQDYII